MSDWQPGETAPKDGTRIKLKWASGKEDIGHWCKWIYPEILSPELQALGGEWSTDFGNASADEYEPMEWMPL